MVFIGVYLGPVGECKIYEDKTDLKQSGHFLPDAFSDAADSELRVVWSAGVASFGDVLDGTWSSGNTRLRTADAILL